MKKVSFLWLSPTLTAIGKKFGFDAHYYARNSFYVTLGQVVNIVRGIITGYLVARFFQKETYGAYKFMLSILGTLSIFGIPGLAHSMTRAWARGDAFSLSIITRHLLKFCSIGSALLLFSIPFLGYYNRAELWPLFLVAAILFPLTHVATIHFGAATVGKAQFGLILRVSIVWSFILIGLIGSILLLRQSALLMIIVSMTVPSVIYLYVARKIRPPAEVGTKNTKSIIRYGWQLTLATLPDVLVGNVDNLVVSQYVGLNQLAVFSVAQMIPEQAKQFVKQLFPISFSKQAKVKDSPQSRRKLAKAVLVGVAIFAVGIGIYILLSPFFIPLLFPNYDSKVIIPLSNLAAATLIFNPGTLFEQYLEAQRMVKEVHLLHWIAAAFFSIALFALVPLYGLFGAILARGLFRFVYAAIACAFMFWSPYKVYPVQASS